MSKGLGLGEKNGAGRRVVLQGLLGFGLSGCSLGPTLDLFAKSVTAKPAKTDSGYSISTKEILDIPFASLGVSIDGGPKAILTLATYDGPDLHWISSDRVILVTRSGRLVKTVGFNRDLVTTQYLSPDPLFLVASTKGVGLSTASTTWRVVDMSAKDEYGLQVRSGYEIVGRETLNILGYEHPTLKIRERMDMPSWRWSTDNYFWVEEETGIVYQARQQFCPEVPPIEFQILKPASPAP